MPAAMPGMDCWQKPVASGPCAPILGSNRSSPNQAGISKAQIHRLELLGQFPARVRVSEALVAYYEHEVDAWVKSRIRAGGRRMPSGCRGFEPNPPAGLEQAR